MAKPENRMAGGVRTPETPIQPNPSTETAKPATPETVRVRATCYIGEMVGGEMSRFAPGDEFELDLARAKAIGPLVEIIG